MSRHDYVGAVFVVVSLLMAELATLKINDHASGTFEGAGTLGGTIALRSVVKRIRNNLKQFITIAYLPDSSSAR
jgi:hypothetical protein